MFLCPLHIPKPFIQYCDEIWYRDILHTGEKDFVAKKVNKKFNLKKQE